MIRQRKAWTIFSGLVILGVLAAACAPAAAPGEKPLAAPRATPAPTAVSAPPATGAPVAPKAPPAQAQSREEPKYGGILTTIRKTDPAHFDSQQTTSTHTLGPVGPAYNRLVRADPMDPARRRIIPDLAERWEISPDGKAYTFYLRQGVKFHDGTPFSAADVVATLQRMISPPKGASMPFTGLWSPVQGVEALDPSTVKFTLKRPYTPFLDVVGMPHNSIYSKAMLDKYGDMKKQVMGTGPFKLKEYTTGVVFELQKNPQYFISGRPYLDGIRGYIIPDFAAMRAAIATGRVLLQSPGIIYMLPSEQEALREKAPQILQAQIPVPGPWGLKPNTKIAPWNDVRVRKAVWLSIDRYAALTVLAQGLGTVWGGYMPPGEWALPRAEWENGPGFRKPKDQDIAEAKKLLAEAGYPKGFKARIVTRATPDWAKAGVFGADQLGKIGIEATVDAVEIGAYSLRQNKGDFDLLIDQGTAPISDPEFVFGLNYLTGAGGNWGKYSDPRIDDLYLKQSTALDPVQRQKFVNELDRVALETVPAINYFWIAQTNAWWPQVRNYVPPSVSFYGFDFQDVWLAE